MKKINDLRPGFLKRKTFIWQDSCKKERTQINKIGNEEKWLLRPQRYTGHKNILRTIIFQQIGQPKRNGYIPTNTKLSKIELWGNGMLHITNY